MSRWLLGLVALAVVAAGCFGGNPTPTKVHLDGQAAYEFTAGLVTDDAGGPRYRVPGSASHGAAGDWLLSAMQVPGWTAHKQEFTGRDYERLEKGQTSYFVENSGYCSSEEKQRVQNLTFQNYWAIHDQTDVDRLVLLGAHWDSKRFASGSTEPVLGANDGAAGVGLLLQFMRHITKHEVHLPFDVGVVFFDGEDGFEDCHPLAGSIYFVSQTTPGQVDRMILLDMIGDIDARFIREGHSVRCDPSLVDLFHALAPAHELAENFPGISNSGIHDDHLPFITAGIPAIDLIDYGRNFPPYWHTTGDTLDKISPVMLGRMGDLVLDVLGDARFTATWPTGC